MYKWVGVECRFCKFSGKKLKQVVLDSFGFLYKVGHVEKGGSK